MRDDLRNRNPVYTEVGMLPLSLEEWRETEYSMKVHGQRGQSLIGSVETANTPTDKYDLATFAQDDPRRFLDLIQYLSPRDAEIMLCFAVLRKRPTDISTLFGKAGHRAEEDLHKAAHKLAGLVSFGHSPNIGTIKGLLDKAGCGWDDKNSLASAIWQYARCRDFGELARLTGSKGLRQQMLRAFKTLHASDDREAGLLAGWILWLVDGSNPHGKGWRERKRTGREYQLGPTVFHVRDKATEPTEKEKRWRSGDKRRAHIAVTGRGGQGQRPDTMKVTRHMKFILRGFNA